MSHPSVAALRHRNFRLLWLGLLFSFTGSMMQNAALLWHVSLLVPDNKGLALGGVGLAKVLPIAVFSMISGVVADAWDRRRVMLLTQSGSAAVAAILAVLTWRGLDVVWPIYALAALGAGIGSFDLPARQSLVPTLVPRRDLPNAISLNMIMLQTAAMTGPAVGGLVIAGAGLTTVYAANALTYGCVIAALLLMRHVPVQAGATGRDRVSWQAAREGFRFVFTNRLIRSTMLLDFFATLFSPAVALLPIFAQDVLRVGPRGYGWLYAAPAVGATLTSGMMVLWTARIVRRGRVLLYSVAIYGAANFCFGLSRHFWLTFACLAVAGASDTVSAIIRNIVRQMETPDHLRGRMTGINMLFFQGGPQLGEVQAGAAANWLGAPAAVLIGASGSLLATAWVAGTTPLLRHYTAGSVATEAAIGAAEPPRSEQGDPAA